MTIRKALAIGWLSLLGLAVLAALGRGIAVDTWTAVGVLVGVGICAACTTVGIKYGGLPITGEFGFYLGVTLGTLAGLAIACDRLTRVTAFVSLAVVGVIISTVTAVMVVKGEGEGEG